MSQALVCRIASIRKHPNADRLDLVDLTMHNDGVIDVTVVTGPHYRAGQRGVWISPGSIIPGYLAEDLWLCGRGGSNQWHEIGEKNMRGIVSPGMFCGEIYQKVRSDSRSVERYEKLKSEGAAPDPFSDWITWPFWRDHWKDGEDVSAYLGIRT